MFYSVRHLTCFRYRTPVREAVMELRMQPRSEGHQTLRSFQISTHPRAQLYAYTDHLGNAVYHFNLLREHEQLRIEAQATVEMALVPDLPEKLDDLEWQRYNGFNLSDDHFDMLEPSRFARSCAALESFMTTAGLQKPQADPLTALRSLQAGIYAGLAYESGVTEVDSPIAVALEQRRGVCQDFAHIMTAVARRWGIPARYVSGYLYHKAHRDRSAADATHAWVEAYLPSLGWVGFDPTNNIMAGGRHVRAAVGRDYADVPPTRGTYKGAGDCELSIAVSLEPTQAPVRHEDFLKLARPAPSPSMPERLYQQQQQQQ